LAASINVAQRLEGALDLAADPLDSALVGLLDVAGYAKQVLVVPRSLAPIRCVQNAPGGIRTRAARLKRPPL
jgi:hypothetical protein